MAPKVENAGPPVPTDVAGIQAALTLEDPAAVVSGLTAAVSLDAQLLQKEAGAAADLIANILQHIASGDGAIKTAAAVALARLASIRGEPQNSLLNEAFARDLWAVITEFSSSYEAYKEAWTGVEEQILAAKSDAAKKAPPPKGAPPPVDPETTLPGPGKHLLDAVLRALATLASYSHQAVAWLGSESLTGLAQLLSHHSIRVQYRAARLVALLARLGSLHHTLMLSGVVTAMVSLLKASPSGPVRLEVLQALLRLTCEAGPQHVHLVEQGMVEVLLQHMLAPETGAIAMPSAADAAGEGATPAPAPTPLDMTKPARCKPVDIQLAAGQLLLNICVHDQDATEQLAKLGALSLLMAMLTKPPGPSPTTPPQTLAPGAAFAPAASLAPLASVSPAGFTAADTVFAALLKPTIAITAGKDEPQEPPKSPWLVMLEQPCYPLPTTQASYTPLQANLLSLVAHILTVPEVLDAVWTLNTRITMEQHQQQHQQQQQQQQVVTEPSTPKAAPQQGMDASQPDASAANAASASPLLAAPLHQLLLSLATAPPCPAPAPATEPVTSAKGSKGGKDDKGKGAKPKEVVPQDSDKPAVAEGLAAPVTAAAIEALKQLAKHPQYGPSLAASSSVSQLVREGASTAAPEVADAIAAFLQMLAPMLPEQLQSSSATQTRRKFSSAAAAAAAAAAGNPAGLTSAAGAAAVGAAGPAAGATDSSSPSKPPGADTTGQQPAAATAVVQQPVVVLPLTQPDAADVLKKLAAQFRTSNYMLATTSIARSTLALPDKMFVAPARPPLPSPPPTPPPPPLATNAYVWDALDRPMMTDGSVRLVHM